jgi:putative ABC transport system substrate-binding protein
MKRREFITVLGGMAACAFAAQAEPGPSDSMRPVGILLGWSHSDPEGQARLRAFTEAFKKLGWSDGFNVQLHVRWLDDRPISVLDSLASDLLSRGAEVIVTGGTPSLAALQRATKSVPVVFAQVSDPVGAGFVSNIAHPGGNVTGFTDYEYTFSLKWLQLLKELAPDVGRVGVVHDVNNAISYKFLSHMEALSASIGVSTVRLPLRNFDDVDRTIGEFAKSKGGGLVILAGALTQQHRNEIVRRAANYRLPAVYPFRLFAESGGLISYGADVLSMYQGAAVYVDRILNGAKLANLPVQFATRFELVLNLRTAKALGLVPPSSLTARADEVIE